MTHEWKAENHELMNEYNMYSGRKTYFHFKWENLFSDEEKIEFINAYHHTPDFVNKVFALVEKYISDADKGVIKFDKGSPKTVSYKAWLNKNDTENLTDKVWAYGHIYGASKYSLTMLTKPENIKEFTDEIFKNLLYDLMREEQKHFCTTDEYEIAKTAVKNNPFSGLICDYGWGSDGSLFWGDLNLKPITLEECNKILAACKKAEESINAIRAEFEASLDK